MTKETWEYCHFTRFIILNVTCLIQCQTVFSFNCTVQIQLSRFMNQGTQFFMCQTGSLYVIVASLCSLWWSRFGAFSFSTATWFTPRVEPSLFRRCCTMSVYVGIALRPLVAGLKLSDSHCWDYSNLTVGICAMWLCWYCFDSILNWMLVLLLHHYYLIVSSVHYDYTALVLLWFDIQLNVGVTVTPLLYDC